MDNNKNMAGQCTVITTSFGAFLSVKNCIYISVNN